MNSKTKIHTQLEIDAPKERVWTIISNLGGIHNFHPLVNDITTHLKRRQQ
ncbi:MAG: hypothetical protein ACW98D_18990 [Promethearchaeota archaeon]|jgi:hypothetical protein